MKIKLRGKVWKQITPEEYKNLEGEKSAIFIDNYYKEKTYFKEIDKKIKKIKEEFENENR